jgi:putative transposon-encoded protein
MIRRRLLQLTIPLIGAFLLLSAIFFFFASFGSSQVAANATTYGVGIGPDNQAQAADGGDTITYTYWVSNTGDSTDTYTITAANELGWPTDVSSETVTIASQISDTVVLTIEVDSAASAGPVITTITATSSSPIFLSGFSTNTTTINAAYGVEIVENESITALPGTTVVYSHTVTNLGNSSDTFDITADSDKSYTTTVPAPLTLSSGISGTINISIEIPAGESAGVVDVITVTATSQGPSSKSDFVVDTTTVAAVLDVDIEQDESGSADPGATAIYTHTVTNTGNKSEKFNISASSDQPFVTRVSPTSLTLNKDESGLVRVEIDVPGAAGSDIEDETTVTAASDTDPNVKDSVTDTTAVNQVYAVKIVKNENSTELPGATVVYEHTVTNMGNGTDTFDITAISNQGFTTTVPDPIVLGRGLSEKFEVSIKIPAGEAAGVIDKMTVTATSGGPGGKSDDVVDTTTVAEVLGVDIKKNESGSADPGTTAVYTHTVTNQGNGTEKFNLTASSNQSFVARAVPSSLTLNKGATGLVRVEIDISESADSNIDDKTTVTASSDTDAKVKDSVIDTTTINKHRLFIPLVNTSTEWNQVGASTWANGDEAISVDVCPTDSDLIFAGTEDALRLFDGDSWTTFTGDVPIGGKINSIVMDESCGVVYVAVFKGNRDDLIDVHGVWEGKLDNQDNWVWRELTGGVDVSLVRKVVLSDGTLFAAGGFGIAYLENDAWIATNVAAGPIKTIMDLSVADGVHNSGPVYAVRWEEKKVFHNIDPGSKPGEWSEISGLADIPDNGWVRSVAGDESNVRYVGTTSNLYRLTGTNWGLVKNQESRTILISDNVYAGFSGTPGAGVYISTDQGANFSPYNAGWTVPDDVFVLVDNPDYLFAATSAGVFKR